jgi:dihydrofolate reductase
MDIGVFIATSLDGFIARPDGAIDWLPTDTSEDFGYNAFMESVDALVMGRETFELVLTFGGWPYGDKPVFVLTSSPAGIAPPSGAVCEALAGAPHEIVAALSARGHARVYLDGGITIQRFLAAGLVDRMIITRIPVLLGRGRPLFGDVPNDVSLEHVTTRAFPSGLVQSEYRVRR